MAKKQQRTRFRDHRADGYSGRRVKVNEHVSMAALEDVVRAMDRYAGNLDWPTVAPNVLPLFPRRRPLPIAGQLSVLLPPGIMTGFGIDAGPALMHLGEDAVRQLGIGTAEVVARALSNLRLRTERSRPRDLVRQSVDGVSIRALQTGQGVASTLLLLPDELVRIFGPARQTFVAPVRDLLVSVTGETDLGYICWLNEEFAQLDPNALGLDAFLLDGGELRLEPLGREAPMA